MQHSTVSSIECPLDSTLVADSAGSDQVAWPADATVDDGATRDGHFRMAKNLGPELWIFLEASLPFSFSGSG